MSLSAMRTSRQTKNSASKKTPEQHAGTGGAGFDDADDLRGADLLDLADLRDAFLEQDHAGASKTSPIRRMRSNLAILQILVANQFDAELLNLFPHAGTD